MIYAMTCLLLIYCSIFFDFLSNTSRFKKILVFVSLFILISISGLRYRLAPDSVAYQWFFNDFTPLLSGFFQHDFSIHSSSYQYFWVLLNSIFYTYLNYYYFQYFISFLSLYIIYRAAKKISKNEFTFLYLLYCTLYSYYSMEVIREFLAISFFIYAIVLFLSGRKVIAILLIVLALFTHRYAFIMIPMFIVIVSNYSVRFKTLFIMLLGSILFYIFYNIFGSEVLDHTYLALHLSDKGIMFNVFLMFMVIFFMLLYKDYTNEFFNGYKNAIYSSLVIYIFILILKIVVNAYFDRVLDYVEPMVLIFYSIILPDFFKRYCKVSLLFIISSLLVIPAIFVYTSFAIIFNTSSGDIRAYSRIYPYYSILSCNKDPARERIISLEAKEPKES